MPGFGSIVGIVFPLLTILAVGGCALLYGITGTLRASNGDLRNRVKDLEDEDAAKATKIKAQGEQIDGQKGELEALRKVITGEVQLTAITELLANHHRQAVTEWEAINTVLTRIDTTMAELLTLIRERPLQ